MILRPFDLNVRHLRAVAAIVEHGSLNVAAATINLSQPALSQGLAKLERQLGGALFERRHDGVTATLGGLVLAGRVRAAIGHIMLASHGGRLPRRSTHLERLMTSTQLRAFLAFADAGSFVGAANTTGLSQPAIHRAVRDLENLFGEPLLDRRGRGVVLNTLGRRFARGTRLAASEIAAAIVELHPAASEGGKIVVGAMPLSRAKALPSAMALLLRAAPSVTISVVDGSWRELIEPLQDGVIDLMIGALRDPVPAGLDQRPLFFDRLAVIARAGHPLARSNPDKEILAQHPWIVGHKDTPLRKSWHAMFAGHEEPPAPIECGSVMTIRSLLLDSNLLTLLSPDQVALEISSGALTVIGPPLPDATRSIGLITRKGWRPTQVQQRLVDLLVSGASLPENR